MTDELDEIIEGRPDKPIARRMSRQAPGYYYCMEGASLVGYTRQDPDGRWYTEKKDNGWVGVKFHSYEHARKWLLTVQRLPRY
jgi:hypothetical protein